jgi:hypothetical protein
MIKKIIFEKKISDKESKELEGIYIDKSFYNTIIEEDCDGFWKDEKGIKHFIFSFRKKVIPNDISSIAIDSFRNFAMIKKENRGFASGPIDINKLPNYVDKIYSAKKFKTRIYFYKKNGDLSKQLISNLSPSNIAGFYDYPISHSSLKDSLKRCKNTRFIEKYPQKWSNSLKYTQYINYLYKKICPKLYKQQLKKANEFKKYTIENTVFSTITLNYSWRSAIHQDKHNIKKKDGAAILTICEDNLNKNTYKGCFLGFPQFNFAVNVRQGDILITDNNSGWHGNTEFENENQDENQNIHKNKPGKKKEWTDKEIINNWHYNRLSMVFYLREGLKNCIS